VKEEKCVAPPPPPRQNFDSQMKILPFHRKLAEVFDRSRNGESQNFFDFFYDVIDVSSSTFLRLF
jgi:hypothetical protein